MRKKICPYANGIKECKTTLSCEECRKLERKGVEVV